MHKRTVAIVLMATTTFTMIPFFWQWINFQYGRHLYADWSAWWSFGTFSSCCDCCLFDMAKNIMRLEDLDSW